MNARKLTAEIGVKKFESTVLRSATFVPSRTASVLTTASFAEKPEMSEVTTRQSPNPSGRNAGVMARPIRASRLSALSTATLRRVSNVLRNQMMTVAAKMTVKARLRKSFAFSQSSMRTLRGDGKR